MKIQSTMKKDRRVVLIIQARMASTRLPGKSMMNLAGVPLVGRILERVKRCRAIDDIILAIPDTELDKALEVVAKRYNVKVCGGAENDLVDRYYKAALAYEADLVVRIPADNAIPEPGEIDRIVEHHLLLNRPGFSSNLCEIAGSGYPDGIGAEVFDFSLLADVWRTETDVYKREHVHLNFHDYYAGEPVDSEWCPVSTIKCPKSFARPDLVLDINTMDQYLFIKEIYETLYPDNPDFSVLDIIDWFDHEYDGCFKK